MKTLKRTYCWILISVFIQVAVLSYINFIYLPGRGTVKATMYESEATSLKNRSFNLPEGASDVTVSYDGLNLAYRLGSSVAIAELDTGKTIKKLDPSGGAITFYRWLPDRDMLIYSTKEPEGKSGQVSISTYDIGPDLDRSYPVIKGLNEGSEVTDIVLSPLTNVVYPKIKTSKTRAKVYKFDIMDNLSFIMNISTVTKIQETMYSDNLVYQTSDGKLRIRNGKTGSYSRLPVKDASKLLAVDDNDFIYAAAADDSGKLTAIYSGKADQEAGKWETLTPDKPLEAENVYVTAGGKIYYADVEEKKISDLEGTGMTEYQGELLTVLDNYAVTLNGSKLVLKILKK